jgi:hypothetical protein
MSILQDNHKPITHVLWKININKSYKDNYCAQMNVDCGTDESNDAQHDLLDFLSVLDAMSLNGLDVDSMAMQR